MIDTGNNLLSGFSDMATANIASSQLSNAQDNLSAISQFKTAKTPDDIKTAAKKFEGMFIGQLMQMMFDTVPVDKEFGGGNGEETFRQFLVDEYGQKISNAGGIGVAKEIEKSLLAKQHAANATNDNAGTAPLSTDYANAAANYEKINKL